VEGGETAAPSLSWLGPCEWTAAQLLGGVRGKGHQRPRDLAGDFLDSFLEDGPRASHEIWDAAQRQGLSARTLQRAKKALAIRSIRVWFGLRQASYWLLPGQELPATADLEPNLDKWRMTAGEPFPPRTPLDDL
jgi:hypothetical protein